MFMHFHQLGLIASHIVFQKSPAINLQSAAELQQIQDPELGRGPSVNQWGNVGSQLLLRPGVQQILDCQIVHLDIQILGCRDWENIQKGWDKLGWFNFQWNTQVLIIMIYSPFITDLTTNKESWKYNNIKYTVKCMNMPGYHRITKEMPVQ